MGNVNTVFKICTMDRCSELLNCYFAAFLQSLLVRSRNSGVCVGTHLEYFISVFIIVVTY